jgi:LCP family protein required for cell wall assembly
LVGKNERTGQVKRRSIGRILYRTLVVLSFLIVLLFCLYKLLIRPPQQAAAAINIDETVTDNPDTEEVDEAVPLVRREQVYTFLLAASDDGNGNADTIMLVTYDVPGKKIGVVSIPRDTLVDTKRSNPKINGAYGAGIDNLITQVSDLVGYPIDFYITVDMSAFKAIVDQVGGIDFYVPIDMDYDDPVQDLHIHYTKGLQPLTGQQALEVARFRKNNDGTGYTDSDLSRIDTHTKYSPPLRKRSSPGPASPKSIPLSAFSPNTWIPTFLRVIWVGSHSRPWRWTSPPAFPSPPCPGTAP